MHCSANAEATASNPVGAPKIFFSGYFRNCLNCDSLRWWHTHFICIPSVHIISFSSVCISKCEKLQKYSPKKTRENPLLTLLFGLCWRDKYQEKPTFSCERVKITETDTTSARGHKTIGSHLKVVVQWRNSPEPLYSNTKASWQYPFKMALFQVV